jgi:hypothetical protein
MSTLFSIKARRLERTQYTFIRTFTGRKFWPLNPEPDELDIRDIAHALSMVCRFTGHVKRFYSVADHSLRVSKLAEKMALRGYCLSFSYLRTTSAREMALWGLMHDASEAYLCDIPSPIKHASGLGELYREYERRLMNVIAERYELGIIEPLIVKKADRILLNTEMRDLMENADFGGETLPDEITPLIPEHAEALFLRRFEALTVARKA